ncbi:hypothetical protein QVD17_13538 [Tagetes erecta]|uniref:DYW domain-containing protein n=1 Tax=Tagetes erecta TaxID=13708 RepID=A0AAD8L0P5_TARER|nr:hypothetical protein QVD17_13538 [Tagetes erecta]
MFSAMATNLCIVILCIFFLSASAAHDDTSTKNVTNNPGDQLVAIINSNRTAHKASTLGNNPGLACIALQYIKAYQGNCDDVGKSKKPADSEFADTFAPKCGVEVATLAPITGRVIGCQSKYVSPDKAFTDILTMNNRSLNIIYNTTYTEVGAAVSGSDGGGPYFWCLLFSNAKPNGSFVLEEGTAKRTGPGCFSGANDDCSGAYGHSQYLSILFVFVVVICYSIGLPDFGQSHCNLSKMLEIIPINGVSLETTILPLAWKKSHSKYKSPKCTVTLSNRFELPDRVIDAFESKKGCKESFLLILNIIHQGLETCSGMEKLKQYHSQIIKLGLSGDNDAMGRVIKFCVVSTNGDLGYALKVFNNLPQPDTFIYNTIFRGYLQFHLPKECISLYLLMLHASVTPNKFTFPLVIKACAFDNVVEQGKQVHAQVLKLGYCSDGFCQNSLIHMYVSFNSLGEARRVFDKMPQQDVVSWTTLISGYSQLGFIDEAREIFDSMPEKNTASLNAMIAAYVQSNSFNEAFILFDRMQRCSEFKLDKFVAASMLSACTGLGALKQGEWIHDNIKKSGINVDPKLASTIIDMYCKCGSVEKAFQAFNELPNKGISSWNCMIGGFAIHGKGKEAVELFEKMENESKISPDYITFVNLLSACAHSGLVKEGQYYFQHMAKVYNISPEMEHYGCLVDLLGRAGLLNEAMRVINEMPVNPDARVLGALAGACKIHGNFELGEKIGKKVIELEPYNSGRYVLLANIYASASKWDDVANVRKLMNDRGVKKSHGFSLIEINGAVNEFVAGGRTHPDAHEIYAKVKEMMACIRSVGYAPEVESVAHDVSEEEEIERALFYHSEKLAIAFGLLKTKPGEILRISKNLRVCNDCHEASKLISKYFGREIIVRDRSRFHHFKQGMCSCNDYW